MQTSLRFEDADDWWAWLEAHGSSSGGEWLQLAKKGGLATKLTYADALDAALCFGWIDGQKKAGSSEVFLQRFTPRKKGSLWSKINCGKALALIEAGRMQPAGFAAIEHAKENGRWDAAYGGHATAEVPDDLAAALRKNKTAAAFFPKLNSQNRYAILFRLQTAKKAETRAARLEKFIGMLARGETIYPQRAAKD